MADIKFNDPVKWDEIDPTNVTVRGFSQNRQFYAKLSESIPGYDFGGADRDSLSLWIAEQWQPLTLANFGCQNVKEFNERVSLRLDLRYDPTTGYIMHRNNIICYAKSTHRKTKQDAKNAAVWEDFQKNMSASDDSVQVHAKDGTRVHTPTQIQSGLKRGKFVDLEPEEG